MSAPPEKDAPAKKETPAKSESPGIRAYRLRATALRRLANRPEPSSISAALLKAALEWDVLADRLAEREKQTGDT